MDDYSFIIHSSNEPKIFCKELRKHYNLTVNDVIIKCNITKYVYDTLIMHNKISKEHVYKICIGLELNRCIALKFFDITGNKLSYYSKFDYYLLMNI